MVKRFISALTGFTLAFSMLGCVPVYAEDTETNNNLANPQVVSDDLTIESGNSLGDILADELASSADDENENSNYTTLSASVSGKTTTVEYHAETDCTMIVGIYDDTGAEMLGKGVLEVPFGMNTAQIDINIDTMPQYFLLKVFMVDTVTYRPLSEAYVNKMYTEGMQNFLALTTDDFDEDKVLNLDEDKTNNFLVYNNDVILLDDEDGELTVKENSANSEKTYIFKNASDRVKSLKAGDVISVGEIEDIVIVKIGDISVEGDTVTISQSHAELEDVFRMVKINQNFDLDDAEFDDSTLPDFVTHETEETESDIETDDQELNGVIERSETTFKKGLEIINYNIFLDGNTKEIDGEKCSISGTANMKGNIGAGFDISLVIYHFSEDPDYPGTNADYSEIKAEIYLKSSLTVNIKGSASFNLGSFTVATFGGVVSLKLEPVIGFEADLSAKLEFCAWSLAGVRAYEGTTQTFDIPYKKEISFQIDGSISISIDPCPKIAILNGIDSDSFALKLHVKVSLGIETEYFQHLAGDVSSVHACKKCIDGKYTIKYNIGIETRLFGEKNKFLSGEFLSGKKVLIDFYYSFDTGDGGPGRCPRLAYAVDFKISDEDATLTIKKRHFDYNKGDYVFEPVYDLTKDDNVELKDLKKTSKIKYISKYLTSISPYSYAAFITDSEGTEYEPYIFGVENHTTLVNIELSKLRKKNKGTSTKPKEDDPPKDDQPTDPKEDDSVPEYLSVVRTKNTLNYKKGNGMKLVEGVSAGGCMGFIDASGTLFIWGILTSGTNYEYYSIPNVKEAKILYTTIAILTKDDNLYFWGLNKYERPTLIAENVKDFCLGSSYTNSDNTVINRYTYVTNNGDLYVHDEKGTIIKLRNVRSISYSFSNNIGACITEKNELYMWGYLASIPNSGYDSGYNDITKIADDVKNVEFGIICVYYITNNGDLHTLGVYNDYYSYEDYDYSDQIRMTGIKEVSTSSITLNALILADNGDLYKVGDNTDMRDLKDMYPDMKGYGISDSGLIIYLNNGSSIGITPKDHSDYYYYPPVKVAGNIKTVTNLGCCSMCIDNNNEIYIWGHNITRDSDPERCGIYDRKGFLWEKNPSTPVKLDDVYANLASLETYTQNTNADISEKTDPFADLLPDCIYNVYGFVSDEHNLTNDDLVYIDQFKTDADGILPFDTANVANGDKLFWLAVPMTRTSIESAEVEIEDLVYNGEEQQVIPKVTLNGNVLTAGQDYYLSGDYLVTDAGEYTITIYGTNLYCGKVSVTFTVSEGSKIVLGDVNGDSKINITDITLVAAHVKGKRILSAEKQKAADVNKDGKINITDITKIAAHVKGKKLLTA
ncbi:dockerin type I repeat-containing protein [Ruminococcus albus]|uniref:Dockerin domain-containing protein n=1 Tax=Ruminococcus albus TaxID=1264 RepID=A0A1I1KGK9_RUMAL|nr:dockerin type I repeat-containing protein [Ruminococcus albus]SFC59959.1 hypothetical protein SAMN02910406_02008 [Ruminococcus albus]